VRVVLDTNAVVSALLFSGISSKLVSLWQKGSITPLLSRPVLDEYLRVLSYPKFELSEKEIKELIQEEIHPYTRKWSSQKGACASSSVTPQITSF
jgi:putative PIN family toxin of toxin-antitoxin system